MEIIDRRGRYMAPGRSWYTRPLSGIKYFTIHHDADRGTDSNDSILQRHYNTHVNRNGWPGIGYTYFIPKDGKIYWLNDFKWLTYHDARNTDALGICLHGYFHPGYNEKPTEQQLKAVRFLLDKLSTKHPEFPAYQAGVLGHRERSSTACPGDQMIGYVTDYRNKLGRVDWGNYIVTPPPPNADQYVSQAKSFMQSALNATVTGSQQNDPNFKSKMAQVKQQAQQIVTML